jgi:hypothetical protein
MAFSRRSSTSFIESVSEPTSIDISRNGRSVARETNRGGLDINNLSGAMSSSVSMIRDALNSHDAYGQSEDSHGHPHVINVKCGNRQGDMVYHQLVMSRIDRALKSNDSDKQTELQSFASWNIRQRVGFEDNQKNNITCPFSDQEVASVLHNHDELRKESNSNQQVSQLVDAYLVRLHERTQDVAKKDAIVRTQVKLQEYRAHLSDIRSYTEQYTRCRVYPSIISRQWRRIGSVESLMVVRKMSHTVSGPIRPADGMQSYAGINTFGPVEIKDIWPYVKSNQSDLYMVYMAAKREFDVPNQPWSGPIVAVPWASDGPTHHINDINALTMCFKDVTGQLTPIAWEYIGSVIDLKGHEPPSEKLAMEAMGLSSSDLVTANRAHDMLPAIKIMLRR